MIHDRTDTAELPREIAERGLLKKTARAGLRHLSVPRGLPLSGFWLLAPTHRVDRLTDATKPCLSGFSEVAL